MGSIVSVIFRTALSLLAGVGVGSLVDKVAADKVPSYPAGGAVAPILKDATGGIDIKKVAWFVGVTAVGAFVASKILKMFKIKLF